MWCMYNGYGKAHVTVTSLLHTVEKASECDEYTPRLGLGLIRNRTDNLVFLCTSPTLIQARST